MNDDQPIPAELTTWVMPTLPSERMPYTPLTVSQLERLHADLHPSRVASRQGGGGRQLSYLEAYDVRATLARIFGYGNFSVEVTETRIVHEAMFKNDNDRDTWRIGALCTVRLTIHQTGAVYAESAAASQVGADYGEVLDFAVKTAESDALKRCATNLGTTFGLSLYQQGATQDIVRVVFSPDQKDIVDDLNKSRAGGPESDEAKARMQARLKTHAPAAEAPAEPPAEAPAEPAAEAAPAEEPQAPVEGPVRRSRAVRAVS